MRISDCSSDVCSYDLQIRAIFRDYADEVEPLSRDEAYLDVSRDRAGLGSATATARLIRRRIAMETGLTASAGVSYNKFIAKLARSEEHTSELQSLMRISYAVFCLKKKKKKTTKYTLKK